MASHKLGSLQAPASCSVCLEAVNDASERSIAKLICGHHFHLDCIGSAFNAKGSMQCPNCRHIENGQWLFANGCRRQLEDSIFEDIMNENEYDVFAGVSELLFPRNLMNFGHLQWCPYQSSYAQLSMSLRGADLSPAAHADLVVNVLLGEHMGSNDSLQPCPFLQALGPLPRQIPVVEENVRVQEIPVHPHHRAPRQQFSPPRGHWDRWAPTVLTPNGGVGGIAFQDRPRWPQTEGQPTGNPFPLYPRNSGRRGRLPTSTQLPTGRQSAHYPANQMSSGPFNRDCVGTSAVHNAPREAEPRDSAAFTQWRQEGASAFRQCPVEPEVQRWGPPPLSGLYDGLHGIYGSELSTQAGFRTHGMQISNHFQGPPFQPSMAEPDVDTRSLQPS